MKEFNIGDKVRMLKDSPYYKAEYEDRIFIVTEIHVRSVGNANPEQIPVIKVSHEKHEKKLDGEWHVSHFELLANSTTIKEDKNFKKAMREHTRLIDL